VNHEDREIEHPFHYSTTETHYKDKQQHGFVSKRKLSTIKTPMVLMVVENNDKAFPPIFSGVVNMLFNMKPICLHT